MGQDRVFEHKRPAVAGEEADELVFPLAADHTQESELDAACVEAGSDVLVGRGGIAGVEVVAELGLPGDVHPVGSVGRRKEELAVVAAGASGLETRPGGGVGEQLEAARVCRTGKVR